MLGKQVTLHRSTDAGGTYGSAIGAIQTMEPPEATADNNETTEYGASHDYKTFVQGLKDGGEMTVNIRYEASQTDADALEDAYDNGTVEFLQLQFPAPISKSRSFPVIVTRVGTPVPKDNQIERVFTFKIAGEVTRATLP